VNRIRQSARSRRGRKAIFKAIPATTLRAWTEKRTGDLIHIEKRTPYAVSPWFHETGGHQPTIKNSPLTGLQSRDVYQSIALTQSYPTTPTTSRRHQKQVSLREKSSQGASSAFLYLRLLRERIPLSLYVLSLS
jgi:hypothetical protein